MTPSNGNNDQINRIAKTRAPVPVNMTKGKRTGNIDDKKNRIAGARVFLCVFVFVKGRRRSTRSRREMKEKEEREEWI
jgi:2-methylisocitrate lyase-like PEP mutase family enzyme